MTRIRAFLTHFAISATAVGIALAIIFFVWYPEPYFRVAGAWSVVQVLIGVDLILGPALTLYLFRPGKPGLKFDLTCVALIQVVALTYGLSVIYSERPYFVVFAVDRFEVLAAKDVDATTIEDERLQQKSFGGPIYAVATVPTDFDAYQQLLEDTLAGKPDIERRPEFWSVYEDHADEVLERGTPLADLRQARPDAADEADRILHAHADKKELLCLPVKGKKRNFFFVVDGSTKLPVDLIDVDPWPRTVPAESPTDSPDAAAPG